MRNSDSPCVPVYSHLGLTKREQFALVLACSIIQHSGQSLTPDGITAIAIKQADSLLLNLETSQNGQ